MVQHDLMDTNQGPTRNHICPTTHKAQVRPTASTTRHLTGNFSQRALITHVRTSLESATPQQLALFWAAQPRTPQMPNVPVFWKHDWTYSGLKIGLHYGPWYVPSATFPPLPKHVRGHRPNKPKLELARSPRWPERARKAERWQQHEMHRPRHRPGDHEPLPG